MKHLPKVGGNLEMMFSFLINSFILLFFSTGKVSDVFEHTCIGYFHLVVRVGMNASTMAITCHSVHSVFLLSFTSSKKCSYILLIQ